MILPSVKCAWALGHCDMVSFILNKKIYIYIFTFCQHNWVGNWICHWEGGGRVRWEKFQLCGPREFSNFPVSASTSGNKVHTQAHNFASICAIVDHQSPIPSLSYLFHHSFWPFYSFYFPSFSNEVNLFLFLIIFLQPLSFYLSPSCAIVRLGISHKLGIRHRLSISHLLGFSHILVIQVIGRTK